MCTTKRRELNKTRFSDLAFLFLLPPKILCIASLRKLFLAAAGAKQDMLLARRLLTAGFVKKPRQHYGVVYVFCLTSSQNSPDQETRFI
jgi:hypothetical protein